MILVSSSGDHLDCFFAGDSPGCVANGRLVGMMPLATTGSEFVVSDAEVFGATEVERVDEGAADNEGDVSSSFGLSRREISTLPECEQEYTGKGRG